MRLCPSSERTRTCAGSEPHPPEEDVAGQGLFVPHSELQADVVEVAGLQAAVGEGVVPLRVDGASLHLRLVLGRLVAVREEVPGGRETESALTVPSRQRIQAVGFGEH